MKWKGIMNECKSTKNSLCHSARIIPIPSRNLQLQPPRQPLRRRIRIPTLNRLKTLIQRNPRRLPIPRLPPLPKPPQMPLQLSRPALHLQRARIPRLDLQHLPDRRERRLGRAEGEVAAGEAEERFGRGVSGLEVGGGLAVCDGWLEAFLGHVGGGAVREVGRLAWVSS